VVISLSRVTDIASSGFQPTLHTLEQRMRRA
jgi:hypothetical protein